MLHRFREHFGTAGLVVAVLALVAALSGGAIAATGGNPFAGSAAAGKSTSQGLTKKQVLALIKANAVPGPQGLQGLPGASGKDGVNGKDGNLEGPPGATGPPGEDGVDGANGTTGKSVLSGSGFPPNSLGTNGDFYIDTSASMLYGPKASNVWPPTGISMKGDDGTDGAEGSPWMAGGTLPSGKTETGAWSIGTTPTASPVYLPISFTLPLPEALDIQHTHYIKPNGEELYYLENVDTAEEGFREKTSAHCHGTVSAPSADAGHLCVYGGSNTTGTWLYSYYEYVEGGEVFIERGSAITPSNLFGGGADTSGTVLQAEPKGAGQRGSGTWAVTAP